MSALALDMPAILPPARRKPLLAIAGAGLALAALASAAFLDDYYSYVLAQIALVTIAASGLNLLVGLAGQISFGHAGFYALGAYSVAILTTRFHVDFWLAWPLGAVLAAVCGGLLALPALRVKGPYLAMVTIAFGLIVEHALVELRPLTGGHNGILGVAGPMIAGLPLGQRGVALLAIVTAIIAVAAFEFISRGPWGAALLAVRDSEAAAESIGLDPVAIRTAAFAASAFAAGLAGGLFPPLAGFVTPGIAGLGQSITLVLAVIVGGAGFGGGPVIGALIVGVLPELLSSLEAYRALAFGALLLVVLWIAPRGIAGLFPPRRPSLGPAPAAATPQLQSLLARRERRTLSAAGLSVAFGGVKAATDVTLSLPPGRITSLIGPNGAGKSTVLNLLSGFYRPDAGERRLGETALPARRPFRTARAGVARTFQHSQLFDSQSVAANVAIAFGRGALRTSRAGEDARALLLACGYFGDPDALAGGLAHVDRRRVEIARALATDPDALLLDEPAAGLSAEDKQKLGELLRELAGCGVAVGLVEHDMDLVMGVSDRVAVLSAGRLIADGPPQAIQADEAVRAAYLGDPAPRSQTAHPAPSAAIALRVQDLVAGYSAAVPVLRGLSMQVAKGEIVAVLGANGAGKTTLMRTLAGLQAPLSGEILLEGGGRARSAAESVRLGCVLVPEGRQMFPEMTVRETLFMGGFTRPAERRDALEEILQRFPALKPRLHQRAGLLSGGEQQMLALGRALMSRPKLLLLDEPSLGLAPRAVDDLYRLLQALNAEAGVAIVLVDQVADLALRLASRAYVLREGVMAAEGSSDEIGRSGALERAYLGASH